MDKNLEKELGNIKKSRMEILQEFRMIRQIRQKKNLNYDESKALRLYEDELFLRQQRNLELASEFEMEYNIPNFRKEVESLSLDEVPLEDKENLTEVEERFLTMVVAKMVADANFDAEVKAARDKNNEELMQELGISENSKRR